MKRIRKIKCALLNRILSWKIDGHLLIIIIVVVVGKLLHVYQNMKYV